MSIRQGEPPKIDRLRPDQVLYHHPVTGTAYWIDPQLDTDVLNRLNRLPGATLVSVCAGHPEDQRPALAAFDLTDVPEMSEILRPLSERWDRWELVIGYWPESRTWGLRFQFPWGDIATPRTWWRDLASSCESALARGGTR